MANLCSLKGVMVVMEGRERIEDRWGSQEQRGLLPERHPALPV